MQHQRLPDGSFLLHNVPVNRPDFSGVDRIQVKLKPLTVLEFSNLLSEFIRRNEDASDLEMTFFQVSALVEDFGGEGELNPMLLGSQRHRHDAIAAINRFINQTFRPEESTVWTESDLGSGADSQSNGSVAKRPKATAAN